MLPACRLWARAGQLLNNMIGAMGLKREEVYIANIVKCRPPANRAPEPVEAGTCSQFLVRQIDIVRPEVIVALGATAATYLLGGEAIAGFAAWGMARDARGEGGGGLTIQRFCCGIRGRRAKHGRTCSG